MGRKKRKNIFKRGKPLPLDIRSFSNDHGRDLLDQSYDAGKVNAMIYLECYKKPSISDILITNLISEFLDESNLSECDFLSECEQRDKKEIERIKSEKNNLLEEMKKDAEYQGERFNLKKALDEIDRILGQ